MNVNCSTCLEILTPSAELSSLPCGHIFHTECIRLWFEKGKCSCPHCRTRCRNNQLRRIYFNAGTDVTVNPDDPSVAQSRIDSLTFQVRCLAKGKKEAEEHRDGSEAKAVALREEVRFLEGQAASAKEETTSYRAQNRLLKGEKAKAEEARREAESLREKLELYKGVEFVTNASAGEVNRKMHQMGDFSKASRELCYMIVAISKELEGKGKESAAYRKQLTRSQFRIDELKASVAALSQSNSRLSGENEKLAADNDHLEEEASGLKATVASLQDAISSPGGDPRQSAINRLLAERPAPSFQDDETPPPDRKRQKVEFGIVGLHHLKDSTNVRSQPPAGGRTTTTTSVRTAKLEDLVSPPSGTFYNGMGGHSKHDEFPTPLRRELKINANNCIKPKKPKGVSRPKKAAAAKGSKPINEFFSALADSE